MATLTTLRNVVSLKTGLANTAGSEQSLIDEWINQGIIEILVRTHVNVECAEMPTIANTWKYILPSGILATHKIWKEDTLGQTENVVRVSEDEILQFRRSSASTTAATTRYATVGSNLLLLWPTPTAVYTLHLFYVPRPLAMTTGADDPSTDTKGRIPTEFHKAIEYYALWQAGDYDDDKSSEMGERYRAAFEDYCTRYIKPAIHRKGGIALPKARVGGMASFISAQNDRYPR